MRRLEPGEVVRFGPFEFDLERHELRRSGIALTVQPQPLRALALLLGRAGRLVEREEMQSRLWGAEPQLDVDRSLNHTIRKLRQVLDDDAQQSTNIQTVPRRGYRFIADISPGSRREDPYPSTVSDDSRGSSSGISQARSSRGRSSWSIPPAERAGGKAWAGSESRVALGLLKDLGSDGEPASPPIRVAVHRFRDISEDRRWPRLAGGVVEELISELVCMRPAGLAVLDLASLEGGLSPRDTLEGRGSPAGFELGIRGCVRRSGRHVRLNAHLIRTGDGLLVGTAILEDELGEIFEVQRRLAQQIARTLILPVLGIVQAEEDGPGVPSDAWSPAENALGSLAGNSAQASSDGEAVGNQPGGDGEEIEAKPDESAKIG